MDIRNVINKHSELQNRFHLSNQSFARSYILALNFFFLKEDLSLNCPRWARTCYPSVSISQSGRVTDLCHCASDEEDAKKYAFSYTMIGM